MFANALSIGGHLPNFEWTHLAFVGQIRYCNAWECLGTGG